MVKQRGYAEGMDGGFHFKRVWGKKCKQNDIFVIIYQVCQISRQIAYSVK
jgi:hypothetical protein